MDFISKTLTVETADGRLVTGVLLAADHQGNVLLTNAGEKEPVRGRQRDIGLVSIPKTQIRTVYE